MGESGGAMPLSETPDQTGQIVEMTADEMAEAEKAMEAGFSGVAYEEPTGDTPPASNEPPADSVEDAAPPAVDEAPPVQEDLAKISTKQFQDLIAKASTVDEIKSAVEKLRGDAFGKLGGLERTIRQLQEGTAAGEPIVVSAEDLAEVNAEYPDMGKTLAKDLTKILGKLKGTGAKSVGPEAVIEQLTPLLHQRDEAVRNAVRDELTQKFAFDRLTDRHENWREIVGPKGSNTEWRQWVNAQPPEYATEVLNSWDPRVVGKSIDKFLEAKAKGPKPPTPANSRSERLAEAAGAKGGSNAPHKPRALTPDEEFEAGYKNARK